METKTIMMEVYCLADAYDVVSSMTVELDEDAIENILARSRLAFDFEFDHTTEYYFAPVWSDKVLDPGTDFEPQRLELFKERSSVESPQLHVGKENFWFSAVPRHCDHDAALSTDHIPLSFLAGDDLTFFKVQE